LLPHQVERLGRVPLMVSREDLGGGASEYSHRAHGESLVSQGSGTKQDPAPGLSA
jgi:hypothetical protein